MTDEELALLLQQVCHDVDNGSIGTIGTAVQPIRDAGILPGQHVGKKADQMSKREVLEWYGGSILDIVEREAWFAVNSWINCLEEFTGLPNLQRLP